MIVGYSNTEIKSLKTITAVRNEHDITAHYLALGNDITPIKEHQDQLERIAHYDILTNLPNRVLLSDRLSQAILLCSRQEQSLAVVFLDLDGFKVINDAFGHDMVDKLLIVLSVRMKAALRENDSLARIGGVTLYPQDNAAADLLMRHADQAMYKAKQLGKNRYHLFDTAQDDAVKIQRESIEAIRNALDNHQFVLYYQPKVKMRTGMVVGVNFSLDDFGTGYSSLTYLRRLPASLIKIDQTFVLDMLNDEDDFAIVEGVITLAKSFKRDVIAKGVETIEHGTALLQLEA